MSPINSTFAAFDRTIKSASCVILPASERDRKNNCPPESVAARMYAGSIGEQLPKRIGYTRMSFDVARLLTLPASAASFALASVNMKRSPPSSDAERPCSVPSCESSGQSPPPEANKLLIAALNTSGSVVTVSGPTPGSLNGESTYFDGSSSVSSRSLTIWMACCFTPSMSEPMLPVVSMEIASVGPTPRSSFSCFGVTTAPMSRMNCLVASLATSTAAPCRKL